jgi:hypothetical protein
MDRIAGDLNALTNWATFMHINLEEMRAYARKIREMESAAHPPRTAAVLRGIADAIDAAAANIEDERGREATARPWLRWISPR